ncbi:MAG: Urea ABC transporter, permease protein UrtC [uncultured Caballeronia sp.]|nr:MAG: Urea ABC transporter, permease protein UrtC [uncultured Caballeronia sp.]
MWPRNLDRADYQRVRGERRKEFFTANFPEYWLFFQGLIDMALRKKKAGGHSH